MVVSAPGSFRPLEIGRFGPCWSFRPLGKKVVSAPDFGRGRNDQPFRPLPKSGAETTFFSQGPKKLYFQERNLTVSVSATAICGRCFASDNQPPPPQKIIWPARTIRQAGPPPENGPPQKMFFRRFKRF